MTVDPQLADTLRSATDTVLQCVLTGTARTTIVDTVLAEVVQHDQGIRALWTPLAAGAAAALVGACANYLFGRSLELSRRKTERDSRLTAAKHEAYTELASAAQSLGDEALDLYSALQPVESNDHMFYWLSAEIEKLRAAGRPPDNPGIQLYLKQQERHRWTTLSEPLRASVLRLSKPMKLVEDNFERSELAFPGFRPAIEALGFEFLSLTSRTRRLADELLKPGEAGAIHPDRDAVLAEAKRLCSQSVEFGSFTTDLMRELQNEMYGAAVGRKLPYVKKAPGSRILTREGLRTVEELDAVNPDWRETADRYERAVNN
jgi:hypothetical protein